MWTLTVLVCAVAASQARSVQEPAAALSGDYQLIYSWPPLQQRAPNCSPVRISAAQSPAPCSCSRPASLALVTLHSRSKELTLLADLVSDAEELKRALSDKCSCARGVERSVVLKLSGGYMLHVNPAASKGFLIGSSVPTAEQLQDIISSLPLDAKDGSLVCQ